MNARLTVAVLVAIAGLGACGGRVADRTTPTTRPADSTVDAPPSTLPAAPPPRCRPSEELQSSADALVAAARVQLHWVEADHALPAETRKILVARYQDMIDEARSVRDSCW